MINTVLKILVKNVAFTCKGHCLKILLLFTIGNRKFVFFCFWNLRLSLHQIIYKMIMKIRFSSAITQCLQMLVYGIFRCCFSQVQYIAIIYMENKDILLLLVKLVHNKLMCPQLLKVKVKVTMKLREKIIVQSVYWEPLGNKEVGSEW